MTFQKRKKEIEEEKEPMFKRQEQANFVEVDQTREFKQYKHVFEITVKELKNIPILDKLVRDVTSNDFAG